MSALQLRVLLEHVTNQALNNVRFAFNGGRLYMTFTDAGGNYFSRSFGTDGGFVDHRHVTITAEAY